MRARPSRRSSGDRARILVALDLAQDGRAARWGTIEAMDSVECLRSGLLNVCDDREVQSLAAALDCRIADLYEAVAFVGDRLCCIRAHIEKRVAANVPPRTGTKLAVVANG